MDPADIERIRRVWAQDAIPVVIHRGKKKSPRLRLPNSTEKRENRAWIRNGRRTNIYWDHGRRYWEIPQAWFNDIVDRCLERFGKVYIIQPYREQVKCAPACWNAVGHQCDCSCMGQYHGSGEGGARWRIVSDTFATRWGDQVVACRLLTK